MKKKILGVSLMLFTLLSSSGTFAASLNSVVCQNRSDEARVYVTVGGISTIDIVRGLEVSAFGVLADGRGIIFGSKRVISSSHLFKFDLQPDEDIVEAIVYLNDDALSNQTVTCN